MGWGLPQTGWTMVYTCFRQDGVQEGDVRNYLNLLNAMIFAASLNVGISIA